MYNKKLLPACGMPFTPSKMTYSSDDELDMLLIVIAQESRARAGRFKRLRALLQDAQEEEPRRKGGSV